MPNWHDDEDSTAALNDLIGTALRGEPITLPAACGACDATAVHLYFHEHRERRGGVWAWCSGCRGYLHGSALIPQGWRNLTSVDERFLTATPVYLDERASAIDAHWNALQRE